jgi:hypothetical protein
VNSSGPQYFSSSFISGHDSGYGGVREYGFLSFRFCCRMGELHPYGSLSNGFAAFCCSPSVDDFKSKPVDAGGSRPTKLNLSRGQPKAGAWRS